MYICALCNSGGGVLSISLDKIYFTRSERMDFSHIIRTRVCEMQQDKIRADFFETNSIVLMIKGCEKIVAMKYNTFILKDGKAKVVQSIEELRSLLNGPQISAL